MGQDGPEATRHDTTRHDTMSLSLLLSVSTSAPLPRSVLSPVGRRRMTTTRCHAMSCHANEDELESPSLSKGATEHDKTCAQSPRPQATSDPLVQWPCKYQVLCTRPGRTTSMSPRSELASFTYLAPVPTTLLLLLLLLGPLSALTAHSSLSPFPSHITPKCCK